MSRVKKALWIIIGIAVAIGPLTMLVPEPASSPLPGGLIEFRVTFALLSLLAWLHIGAAILFVLGLGAFKQRLKNAYFLICSGLVLLGLNMVQLPVLGAFNLWEIPWIKYGGLSFPYTVGLLLIYFGFRSFAGALRLKGWVMNVVGILLIAGGAGAIGGTLLGDPFNVEFAGRTLNLILSSIIVVMVLKLKNVAGPAYSNALAWFFLAMFMAVVGEAAVLVFDIMHTQESSLVVIPFALSSGLFVKAAVAFNEISEF